MRIVAFEELDVVRLDDGREATILEILGDGKAFLVETAAGAYEESEWFEVSKEKIQKVLYRVRR